jgi:2-C-methyl-D-erythritol 4-phosphate cytidylyltransferase
MTRALIFAGGTGQRMNTSSKPKQFLELYGKPIIIYTLEYFENHPEVDDIVVVCLKSWIGEFKKLKSKYKIKKVSMVVEGGPTGHESIYNGLKAMEEKSSLDDIVLIHDGVRPIISEDLITDNINTVKLMGSAITVSPVTETVMLLDTEREIESIPNRDLLRLAKAPQSFYYKDIWSAHKKAKEDKLLSWDSADLMKKYGYKLATVESTPYNIKITSPSDYYIFRALFEARENLQIFGI